jgi:hypothetical protein
MSGHFSAIFFSVRHFWSKLSGICDGLRKEALKKSHFQNFSCKFHFWTFLKPQKCPNRKFFDQSLVASFFQGKGTPFDFGFNFLQFYLNSWETIFNKKNGGSKTMLFSNKVKWLRLLEVVFDNFSRWFSKKKEVQKMHLFPSSSINISNQWGLYRVDVPHSQDDIPHPSIVSRAARVKHETKYLFVDVALHC